MSDGMRNGAYTRDFGGNRPSGARDPIHPRFHVEAIEDPAATAREGRPIFRHEERVQFLMPGSPNSPVQRVNQEHIDRWPDQYAAFKRGSEIAVDGTPVEQWNILSKPMVLELKAIGFLTVEQIADASDLALQKIPRLGFGLRAKAKAYLDDAEASKLTEQLSAADEANKSRIAAQDRQIEELKAMVDKLHTQVMRQNDAPPAVQTYIPGDNNPIEAARMQREQRDIDNSQGGATATSALEGLLSNPAPRRGRPPKES